MRSEVKVPEGWERCEYKDADGMLDSRYGKVYVGADALSKSWNEVSIRLSLDRWATFSPHDLDVTCFIPVRKVTPKPVILTVFEDPFDQYGGPDLYFESSETKGTVKASSFPAGTQFIQVTAEVRAALAKGGIEVGS